MGPKQADGIGRATPFEIRPLVDGDLDAVLAALTDAFGDGFDAQWFQWKHRSGPWGPSRGWVAHDDGGLAGVRLFLPWRFTSGSRSYRALRPCDTVTVGRARGQGVFRKLTETAIAEVGNDIDFFYNTPNEESRGGYFKMGFVQWTTVGQRIGVIRPRGASLRSPWLNRWSYSHRRMVTAMSDEFLAWRYERCPRHEYTLLGLANSATPNGVVSRLRHWRGLRLLVVAELWGSQIDCTALVRAAAHRSSTSLVWFADIHRRSIPVSFRRPGTLVTRYDVGAEPPLPASFSLGDLEAVL